MLELICEICGSTLNVTLINGYVSVTPCEYCFKSVREEGRVQGYEEGYRNGAADNE